MRTGAFRHAWSRSASAAKRSIFVTLKEELSRAGELDEVGGPAYIASLADGVPRSANVEYYARIVKEKSTLRSLIHSANKILADGLRSRRGAGSACSTRRSARSSRSPKIGSATGFVPLRDLVQSSFATIEKLQQHKGLVTGVPTGFVDLDEMTSRAAAVGSGHRRGAAVDGEDQLRAEHRAARRHVERHDRRLLQPRDVEGAAVHAHADVRGADRRAPASAPATSSEKDYGRLSQALGTLAEARVFIDDTASIGVLEMRAKARRLKAEHGLHLLIIDYIQLMQGRGRFESRQAELASISRSLKGLAKELSVPIVALSQLSRAPETRSDHRPQLSDLRESGALEQDADVVMFIFREEQYRDADGSRTRRRRGPRRSSSASSATARSARRSSPSSRSTRGSRTSRTGVALR